MTTIVADKRLKIMCADRKVNLGTSFSSKKIFQMKDGTLLGISGDLCSCLSFVEWFKSGKSKTKHPDFNGDVELFHILELSKDGLFLWDSRLIRMEIDDDFFSIGSGSPYALAALYCGKSPDEAIVIASQLDPYTGSDVDSCYLKKPRS